MDREAVIEFLGHVPLLRSLPRSSLKKIAELVDVKCYDRGDYVLREGEVGDDIYFIWEGEAKVLGHDNVEEGNCPKLLLKKYDHFGYGVKSGYVSSCQQDSIIALSKLTCLVLHHENSTELQLKSIGSADETLVKSRMLEDILHVELVELDIFSGITLPGAPIFEQVFGGQLIGQALAAASKTVDSFKLLHSLHGYFLLGGDPKIPIMYHVFYVRDGKSFATRRVDAVQEGKIRFTLFASFQKEEHGFDHQDVRMPAVPAPEMLLPLEELREKRFYEHFTPSNDLKVKVNPRNFVSWPVEIRLCEQSDAKNISNSKPSLKYWLKSREKLSDDQALHRCVVAYASDFVFFTVSLIPSQEKWLKTASLSLDHSMWFHRSFRADEWLLYVIESPCASNSRGYCSGRIFNRKGELVVSVTQEGVTRIIKTPSPLPNSKL